MLITAKLNHIFANATKSADTFGTQQKTDAIMIFN